MNSSISWDNTNLQRSANVNGPPETCVPHLARCILFLIIWLVTGGRHHFWFLPNLTADVGFIDSFRPLYTHEYKGPRASSSKKSLTDKADSKTQDVTSKAQKSDSEEKSDSEKRDEEDDDEEESKEGDGEVGDVAEGETLATERHSDTDSERREDEGSQHSNGNDFEMITREELEQHTEEEEEEEEDREESSAAKPDTAQT